MKQQYILTKEDREQIKSLVMSAGMGKKEAEKQLKELETALKRKKRPVGNPQAET